MKGWIKILSDSCGSRGFIVRDIMSLKQWQCLSASSLECAGEHTAVSSAQFPTVSSVTCHLFTDRCFLADTVPTYIILPLAFSNSLVPSEHLAATSMWRARDISGELSLIQRGWAMYLLNPNCWKLLSKLTKQFSLGILIAVSPGSFRCRLLDGKVVL